MATRPADDSERRTRKRRIDPKLKAAGWTVAKYDPAHPFGTGAPVAVEEFPTEHGPVDYALCADGAPLGIVEAKKVTLDLQNVLTQAERCVRGSSRGPRRDFGRRPVRNCPSAPARPTGGHAVYGGFPRDRAFLPHAREASGPPLAEFS